MAIGEEYPTSGQWPLTRVIGVLLIILGVIAFLWVLWGAHQLFTHASSFQVFDEVVPQQIVLTQSRGEPGLLLPREFLIYGIPLGLLGLVTKLGGSMLKWGIDCLELKARRS